MPESKAEITARENEIRAKARDLKLHVSSHDGIVTVYGSFPAGDKEAYATMEMDAYTILRMFRQVRSGSTWGTDSGSVGGQVGLDGGYVRMNKSGCEKRLAARFEN